MEQYFDKSISQIKMNFNLFREQHFLKKWKIKITSNLNVTPQDVFEIL